MDEVYIASRGICFDFRDDRSSGVREAKRIFYRHLVLSARISHVAALPRIRTSIFVTKFTEVLPRMKISPYFHERHRLGASHFLLVGVLQYLVNAPSSHHRIISWRVATGKTKKQLRFTAPLACSVSAKSRRRACVCLVTQRRAVDPFAPWIDYFK